MSASGKSLLGLWLYRSGEQEWAVKEGSPIHKPKDFIVIINLENCIKSRETFLTFFLLARARRSPSMRLNCRVVIEHQLSSPWSTRWVSYQAFKGHFNCSVSIRWALWRGLCKSFKEWASMCCTSSCTMATKVKRYEWRLRNFMNESSSLIPFSFTPLLIDTGWCAGRHWVRLKALGSHRSDAEARSSIGELRNGVGGRWISAADSTFKVQ